MCVCGVCVCVWGGTLIFSYIYISSDHFWGFKILNFIIHFFFGGGGGGVRNIIILLFIYLFFFWGGGGGVYEDVVDISLQNWSGFRGHFYTFQGFFLRSMCRMGIFWGSTPKLQIFFGVRLIFPIYFGGRQ